MDERITSKNIIKLALLILVLIVVILFVSFFTSKSDTKTNEVEHIVLSRNSLTLTVGSDYTFIAIISPSNAVNNGIFYTSSNNYVASVDSAGRVSANSPGEAIITATTANGKQDECTILVVEKKVPVDSIELDKDDITLIEGESVTLNVKVLPSNTTDHNYSWTSSDPSVASVDSSGKVLAKKAGTTLITVMTENKKMAICDIEVKERVTSIKLDISDKTISVGDTLTLNAKVEPSDAKVTWSSSNKNVASVSNGTVKALSVGETTITAEAGSFKASAKIKVKIVTTSDIYKFKYVKNQMDKPLMACNTYTAQDRIELESQLSRAIARVGYGTRAGVVEAARFLVGALDYRVPYLGPKSREIDPEGVLGYYNQIGLNIGHNRGWGCYVYGWKQGIDCTGFVSWAFKNGGVGLNGVYSDKNTYPSSQVVDRIRPGDLMLTPCYESCRFESKYSHVGIVIGVDSKKIYVAESTTGSIDSIVITELDKSNMPTRYTFAVTRLYEYASDGKLTDMWD